MAIEHESEGTLNDVLLTHLYLAAEEAQLPQERPYDIETGLLQFGSWLDEEEVERRQVRSPEASQPPRAPRRRRLRSLAWSPLGAAALIGLTYVLITAIAAIGHVGGNWLLYVSAGQAIAMIVSVIPMVVEALSNRRPEIIRAKTLAQVEATASRAEARALLNRARMRDEILMMGMNSDKIEKTKELLRLMAINPDLPPGRRLDDETLARLLTGVQNQGNPTAPLGEVLPIGRPPPRQAD
jgi:hypothetical protein